MIAALPARMSATTAAEHALRRAILSGELAAGDRLPPERELSATLGVSRLTLRAALATLSSVGLLTVRQGSGYTVCDVRDTGGADLLPGLVELAHSRGTSKSAIGDLLRLRRHLAAAVLDALAEHPPTATARRVFRAAVDRFAIAAENRDDHDALAAADLAVVRALLDATNSMVLRVCLNPIIAIVRGDSTLRASMYAEPAGNLVGWRALAVWLDDPTPTAIPILLGVLADRDRATLARLARGQRAVRSQPR